MAKLQKSVFVLLCLGTSLYASPADYVVDFELPASGAGFNESDWLAYGLSDVVYVEGPDRATRDAQIAHSGDHSLKITYPRAGVGPQESGHQAPIALAPATEYTVSYWLRFDENFSWGGTMQGGKLPGLAQGKSCSGGDICDGSNGFTARFMWRENGAAVLYLYHLDKPGRWGEDFPLRSATGEPLFFKRGKWVNLVQRVRINSGTEANGEVQVWVNGTEALALDGLRFVTDGSRVDRFYISTFHGGSGPEWGPMNDSFIWIDDIEIRSSLSP